MKRQALCVAILFLTGCEASARFESKPKTAEPDSPLVSVGYSDGISIYCDRRTLDRLYVASGTRSGIAVIPKGCEATAILEPTLRTPGPGK